MDNKVFHLFTLGLIFSLASGHECPKECQCNVGGFEEVYCDDQNITDKRLVEIAKQLNPMKVKVLSFQKNNITDFQAINFVNFTKLRTLYLKQNSLAKIPTKISSFIPSITSLSLEQNKLSVIVQDDFEGYQSIEDLDIEENGIYNLEPNAFKKLSSLTTLEIQRNRLKTLKNGTFNGLRKLKKVYLYENDIETIETRAFSNLSPLESIDLTGNKLNSVFRFNDFEYKGLGLASNGLLSSEIKDGAFNAGILNLNDNNLTTIRKEWFVSIPWFINLSDNPLLCDCILYDTLNFFCKGEPSNCPHIIGTCNDIKAIKTLKKFYADNKLS